MKNRFKKYKSSWLLALVPTLIIIYLLPPIGQRYEFTIEPFDHGKNGLVAFEDLNSDGESEFVSAFAELNNPADYNTTVIIGDHEINPYEQWNLTDSLYNEVSSLDFGDYDDDGFKEIYLFTRAKDSIFLNVNELFDSTGLQLKKFFVTTFNQRRANHVDVHVCGQFDQDGNGKKELYFSITTGFGLWPRLVYYLDLESLQIKSSPYTSINLTSPEMADIDHDGHPEIFGFNSASGNHHIQTPYSDYTTWIMVYDDQLQFKFKPIGFEGFGSSNYVKAYRQKNNAGLVALLNANPATAKEQSKIMLLSPDGEKLKEQPLSKWGVKNNISLNVLPHEEGFRIFLVANPCLILNEDLELIKSVDLNIDGDFGAFASSKIADINFDGKSDLLVFGENKIAFFDQSANMMGIVSLPTWGEPPSVSQFVSQSEKKTLLSTLKGSVFIKTKENPYYLWVYFTYPVTYFFFIGFIFMIQRITTMQIEKREAEKRRMYDLQLRSIKGQLDPHFTFNVLNAIGSMLQLEDRNVAYDYLSKFTRLLRQLISDSDRIYRSLDEELEFVTAYLKLEKIRFEEKFDFIIKLGEDVSKKEMVPIMCIQVFAENAIRHGIMPLQKDGLVSIGITKGKDFLLIIIEDNGIGRRKAAEANPHEGRGLKMTKEFYEILNQKNERQITYCIKDLYEGEEARGTRVEVKIPI